MYSHRKQLYVRYCVGSAFLNLQIFTLVLFLLTYPPRVNKLYICVINYFNNTLSKMYQKIIH